MAFTMSSQGLAWRVPDVFTVHRGDDAGLTAVSVLRRSDDTWRVGRCGLVLGHLPGERSVCLAAAPIHLIVAARLLVDIPSRQQARRYRPRRAFLGRPALARCRAGLLGCLETRRYSPGGLPVSTMLATTNPLREGLRTELTAEPCVVVIFGATGDLTHRKLIPALYHLALDRRLPSGSSLVGFARRPWGDDGFRDKVLDAAKAAAGETFRPSVAQRFADAIRYVQASFEDPEGYQELKRILDDLDAARG